MWNVSLWYTVTLNRDRTRTFAKSNNQELSIPSRSKLVRIHLLLLSLRAQPHKITRTTNGTLRQQIIQTNKTNVSEEVVLYRQFRSCSCVYS